MKEVLAIACLFLSGCVISLPIGKGGRYGAFEVGYRLPVPRQHLFSGEPLPYLIK